MDDYDIWNGLAGATPLVFLIGIGMVVLLGLFAQRNDKK